MSTVMRVKTLPRSTKILSGTLLLVASSLFLIRLSYFRAEAGNDALGTEPHSFGEIQVAYIQLIPRYTIFYPWVLVTSIFAENSVFSFLTSLAVLTVTSNYIDRFWGWKEVVRFVLIVGTVTNLITVVVTILVNMFEGDIQGMNKPLGGGISYHFGFLVVLKQIIPEHNIVLFQGLINFRVKNLPFIFLNIVMLWSLIISRSLYPAVPSIASFLVSYNYLRFYQSFLSDPLLPVTSANTLSDIGSSLITGDASDTFQLVEFFPNALKPYLGVVFDRCYDFASFVGILTPFNDDIIAQSNIRAQKRQEQVSQAQKSVANSVAERRRQVALQVIEERVNKSGDQ